MPNHEIVRPVTIRDVRGFSLVDIIAAITVFSILAAVAIPTFRGVSDSVRMGMEARNVERELQTARLRAVSSNRTIRVRFNCPTAGEYRIVELLGTPSKPASHDATSAAATRCGYSAYPYPDIDKNPLAAPNHDGPIQQLYKGVSFATTTAIEFWPDGTAHYDNGSTAAWPVISGTGVNIALQKGSGATLITKTVNVNGVGKVAIH